MIVSLEEIDGVAKLFLAKFQSGEYRFYAIWKDKKLDSKKVQEIWSQHYKRNNLFTDSEPLMIQMTQQECQDKDEKGQFNRIEMTPIWIRK